MKKFLQRLTGRQMILILTGTLSFALGFVIMLMSNHMADGLDTQNMAKRWSEKGDVSQISCFFSREAGISENSILSFEHGLDSALEEASIISESENENARLWADAYSANGRVSITSGRTTMDVAAVGIGGDFFLFHPLKLLNGSYFSGNDVMKDYIVIDEDAAWQLFGSNDVSGQMVSISGIPHIVAGVVERGEGRLEEAAGLSASVAYVSYETLSKYGTDYGINTFEVVMPNPVTGYAKQYVAENIGVAENEVEVVENTTRFDYGNRFKLLTQFGTRSMSSKAIIYPYWENIARGYEDIVGLLLVFMLLLYIYPAGLVTVALIIAWRRKTWTAKTVWAKVQDKLDRLREKRWAAQKRKKEAKAAPGADTEVPVKKHKTKKGAKPVKNQKPVRIKKGKKEENYEEEE